MHSAVLALRLAAVAICCAAPLAAGAQPPAIEPAVPAAFAPAFSPALRTFSAADVSLLDAPAPYTNPFKKARDAHADYLLRLEADRLLARFRSEAGLEPKAEGYGGWERETVGGHSLGHYLSACAKMYAGTGDLRFKDRVTYVVDELALCQAANSKGGFPGYVAAIPGGKKALAEVAAGDIRSKGFDLNGIWVPWYNLHKQMAGLRDAYLFCGNTKALEVWRGLADYSLSIVGSLSPEQLDLMLRCEHGGMNELAADLWAITKDPKHLDLARRFNDLRILKPLAQSKDILPGLHSNTQIPKVIGAARQHELTADPMLGDAARFFWRTVTRDHSYVTGGNSMNEYLAQPRIIAARLEGNTTETCNTYNMLKLSRQLHQWSGDPAIMDYYERALYNHILASKDPKGDGVLYFTHLRPGSTKPFQRPFEDFTCCVGSGMENHASYADAIYSRSAAADPHPALSVNLFIASELRWNDLGLKVIQETAFPDQNTSTLRFESAKPLTFTLNIRCPAWLAATPTFTLNGEPLVVAASPGSYASIKREWKPGDRLTFTLPMTLTAEPTPDDPDRLAFLFGPVVLAGVMDPAEIDIKRTPHLVCEPAELTARISRTDPATLAFRTQSAVRPADLPLIPLYRVANERYTVYWKRLSEAQWAERQAEIERADAAQRERAARMVDFFQPGEMQPERDHAFDGVFTNAGEHMGRRWRDAGPRGWIAFDLKVPKDSDAILVCTYWGSDTGGREFEISIDGTVIATQTLDHNKPNEFFDVEHPIPASLIAGKDKVRVKLTSKPDRMTGGLFGAGILRAKTKAP